MNQLRMHIGGIKCDNKECNFEDMSVLFEEYDKWLNKSCPDCGCNLLTQQDYDTVKVLVGLTAIVNECVPEVAEGEQLFKMSVEFNGTGGATFSEIEPIKRD